MDPTDIGLFRLAEQRLAWTDRRQQLLAQNVANANTPGYAPRDMAPFAAALSGATLSLTSPMHMAPGGRGAGEKSIRPTEKSPSGNAVSLEDQLSKVADTQGVQTLVLNLHHKYQSMVRLALGRSG
jgi:flagellar basal-body rod protein FlgB